MNRTWTVPELADAAGTTEAIVAALIDDGFLEPCRFHNPGLGCLDDCPIVAIAWRTLGVEVEPEIPDATARWFLSLLPTEPARKVA